MRNINLIPKVPYVQKNFAKIALSIGVFCIAASGFIFTYSIQMESTASERQRRIASLQSEIQLLLQQKQTDPLSGDFSAYSNEVNTRKAARWNWVPVLDLVTSSLPQYARMTSAEVSGAEGGTSAQNGQQAQQQSATQTQLRIQLEFDDLLKAVDYIALLQQSPLVASVSVGSASRHENQIPDKPASMAVDQTASSGLLPGSGTQATQSQNGSLSGAGSTAMSKEQFLESLEKGMPAARSKGDELLNQLRWTVTQQMAGDNLGVEVPDRNFVSPDNKPDAKASSSASSITTEDYNLAKSQYEAFKKQTVDSTVNSVQDNAKATGTPVTEEVKKEEPVYISYRVSLNITLKPPAQQK